MLVRFLETGQRLPLGLLHDAEGVALDRLPLFIGDEQRVQRRFAQMQLDRAAARRHVVGAGGGEAALRIARAHEDASRRPAGELARAVLVGSVAAAAPAARFVDRVDDLRAGHWLARGREDAHDEARVVVALLVLRERDLDSAQFLPGAELERRALGRRVAVRARREACRSDRHALEHEAAVVGARGPDRVRLLRGGPFRESHAPAPDRGLRDGLAALVDDAALDAAGRREHDVAEIADGVGQEHAREVALHVERFAQHDPHLAAVRAPELERALDAPVGPALRKGVRAIALQLDAFDRPAAVVDAMRTHRARGMLRVLRRGSGLARFGGERGGFARAARARLEPARIERGRAVLLRGLRQRRTRRARLELGEPPHAERHEHDQHER